MRVPLDIAPDPTLAGLLMRNIAWGLPDQCWEWGGPRNALGYGKVQYQGRRLPAHRAMLVIAAGPPPEGMVACHSCDNPPCCNPLHLRWGTRAENQADMAARSRGFAWNAKLTPLAAADIRRRKLAGERQHDLAREFGVAESTVSLVVNGRTYRG